MSARATCADCGTRQCGKTTLARQFASTRDAAIFDLESEPDVRRLANPELVLGGLDGLVVLDEIQRLRGRRIGFEMKFNEAPRVTAAMRSVAETLALDHLFVVCPTPSAYPVDPGITVLPITDVVQLPTRIAAL